MTPARDKAASTTTASKAPEGSVSFVGSGPGDPGLLTVRAVELLKGAEVVVTATAVYTEPRLVRFAVDARMGATQVGAGEVTRVVVDAERFMARLA